MKKMIVFFIICILLIGVSFFTNLGTSLDSAKCAAFVINEKIEGYESIQNGNDSIIKVYSNIQDFYTKYKKNIKGFNLYFETFDLTLFAKNLNAQIYRSHNVEGMEMYYGYTNMYGEWKNVNGKKVNIQIAIKDNETIVGFPLILTGF